MKQGLVDHKAWLSDFFVQFLLLITLLVFAAAAHAQDKQRAGSKFNHTSTGFPLTGVHINVECETCHTGGIFKGTPTTCAGCHTQGRRVVATGKSPKHIVTNSPCEVCHTNTVTFLGARFDHLGVQPGACQTCHNSGMAAGKPAGHVATTQSCDQCHRSIAWVPAGYNHAGVTPGTCTTCHGVTSTGKPATHVVTTAQCDTCHITRAWLPASFNHSVAGVVAHTCGNCHGSTAMGKPSNHIPVSGAGCDYCHTSTSSFAPQTMNHLAVGVPTTCITCHNSGTSYLGGMERKSLNHRLGESSAPYTGQADCTASTCHRPSPGTVGTQYINWN